MIGMICRTVFKLAISFLVSLLCLFAGFWMCVSAYIHEWLAFCSGTRVVKQSRAQAEKTYQARTAVHALFNDTIFKLTLLLDNKLVFIFFIG